MRKGERIVRDGKAGKVEDDEKSKSYCKWDRVEDAKQGPYTEGVW